MCGIAGAAFYGESDPRDRMPVVSAMVSALGHRGPDGRGVVACTNPTGGHVGAAAVFGHTRLAILDLSDRASQPMKSATEPIWITYNGEVYNFAAIRAELKRLGHEFSSNSDTEVVLQAYQAWGTAMLGRLRGMFALAIWDGRTNELILARDRLGIKPLYLFRTDNVLLFASEVRALLASGHVPRRLDCVAVEQYLAYQTVPTPRTLVEDVRMLEPGHVMRVGANGGVDDRCYWDLLDAAFAPGRSGTDRDEDLHARLVDATRLHLVSDVPVGVFLSGGIDSSALVALAQQAGTIPRTFTVVMPGTPHDEGPFARCVAERFGAEHLEIPVGERELRDAAIDAVAHTDHPSGDGVNSFVVSRAVRAAGIKVALSGIGGDEMFGGYPSFRRLGRLAAYARLWRRSPQGLRGAAAATVRMLGRASVGSVKAAALLETDGSVPRTFPLMRQLFTSHQRRELVGHELVDRSVAQGDPYVALLERAVERHTDIGLMALVAYAEARTYMHDVLLRDADQMSMAHGLEVRVPLLDHQLAEYIMRLPDAMKAPGDRPKRLLVESLGAELPAESVQRPKQGFVLPFDTWMRGELRPFCEERLGPRGLAGRGLFSELAVENVWRSFLANDGRTSWSRAWALVALEAWMERNGVAA